MLVFRGGVILGGKLEYGVRYVKLVIYEANE